LREHGNRTCERENVRKTENEGRAAEGL
jgi:hypothetical protein